MTYTRCGQEILHNGRHFADAVTQAAAETILEALCAAYEADQPDERQVSLDLPEWAQPAHRARREGDEMVCHCGKRWDYREEHP